MTHSVPVQMVDPYQYLSTSLSMIWNTVDDIVLYMLRDIIGTFIYLLRTVLLCCRVKYKRPSPK